MAENTLFNFVSTAGALLSAGAAFCSALIAKNATDHAKSIHHRELVRDVIKILHTIVSETVKAESLLMDLLREQDELVKHPGLLDGDKLKKDPTEIEAKRNTFTKFQQEALNYLENIQSLSNKSDEDLTNILVTHEGYLIHLKRVKDSIKEDLSSINHQIENNLVQERNGFH